MTFPVWLRHPSFSTAKRYAGIGSALILTLWFYGQHGPSLTAVIRSADQDARKLSDRRDASASFDESAQESYARAASNIYLADGQRLFDELRYREARKRLLLACLNLPSNDAAQKLYRRVRWILGEKGVVDLEMEEALHLVSGSLAQLAKGCARSIPW